MGSWGKYKRPSGGGGGLFIRVESGQPGVEFLVPPGMIPHERYVRWDDAAGTYVDEDGPGEGISVKILLAVVRPSGEPGILEVPPGTFADLCDALDHPKVGGVEQVYEVSKTGTGKSTRWSIVRLDRATPDQIARAARAALPEITKGRPMTPSGDSAKADELAKVVRETRAKTVATQDIREPGDEPDADIPF